MAMKRKILFIRKLAYYLRIYGVREVYRIMKARRNQPYNFDDYKWYQKKHKLKVTDAMFQRAFSSDNNFLICLFDVDERIEIEASTASKSLAKSTYTNYKIVTWKELLEIIETTNEDYQWMTHVIFGKKDDIFSRDYLFEFANALDRDKYIDMLYCDSDHYDKDNYNGFGYDPYFKPDFSPDYLEEFNYIGMGYCVTKELVRKAFFRNINRNELDLVLTISDVANSIELPGGGSKNIAHLPKMLYRECVKDVDRTLDRDALQKHFVRHDEQGEWMEGRVSGTYHLKRKLKSEPLVSIIIPNMDHLDDLKKCIDSFEKSTYKNIEFVIVENNSRDSKLFDYYNEIKKRENVKVIEYHDDFNFSQICNRGVEESNGELLLFLNNDTELLKPDSVEEMVANVLRDEVGIVGARLLYEDDTVQHAGVTLGVGGFACHSSAYINDEEPGYMNRSLVMTDVSAVTAACLMISRELFDEVDGFDEEYRVAANDVDLCMKVLYEGYKILYNPYVVFHHYESKSRGDDRAQMKKAKRLQSEVDHFAKIWKDILVNGDRYYNSNFSRGFEYKIALRKQKWHRAFFYRR